MIPAVPADAHGRPSPRRERGIAEPALVELLAALDASGYDFVTPTPATHARVVARAAKRQAGDLRDVFGWNLPFASDLLPPRLLDVLGRAGLLNQLDDGRRQSKVRVARLRGQLFVHSGYPTTDANAVFLGPDSYRFVDFVLAELPAAGGVQQLVDLGAGAGVGGISAARLLPDARVTLVDVNPAALRLAAANAAHAGVDVACVKGRGLEAVDGSVDLVIANPPYIMDDSNRTYRDGGGLHGAQIAYDWTIASARRLAPGGRMLLYTGVAIVAGRDELRGRLVQDLPALGCTLRYREIDPDVFGEELDKPAYADVERIAVVSAVIERTRL